MTRMYGDGSAAAAALRTYQNPDLEDAAALRSAAASALAKARKRTAKHCQRCAKPMRALSTQRFCSAACRWAEHQKKQRGAPPPATPPTQLVLTG